MAEASKPRTDFEHRAAALRTEMGNELAEVRSHVRRLQVQRREVASLPVTKDAALRRIERFVGGLEARAAQFAPDLEAFLRSPASYELPGARNTSDVLARFLARMLLESMCERLGELDVEDGISDAERAERLAKLDRDLLDAELVEEGLIRTAEAAGFQVARRADADPAAVLAAEEALP